MVTFIDCVRIRIIIARICWKTKLKACICVPDHLLLIYLCTFFCIKTKIKE